MTNSYRAGNSTGGGVERAFNLVPDALHGAGAYANLAGNLYDAVTRPQPILDAPFELLTYPGPTKRLARLYGPF
jgi:hypothetical protein